MINNICTSEIMMKQMSENVLCIWGLVFANGLNIIHTYATDIGIYETWWKCEKLRVNHVLIV